MLLDTPICDFGWQAPELDLPDTHGRMHTLDDHMGPGGILIAFICNHCPYVVAIADRLARDCTELMAAGIGVLAVMSNDYESYPADSPENMLKFADQHGFGFPYLVDAQQSVARSYGAVCTPDFFGFNAQGGLQYRGRLDDLRMGTDGPRKRELVDAMLLIASTGNGPAQQTASMGCSIKWR